MVSRRNILKGMAGVACAGICGWPVAGAGESKGAHTAKFWHAMGDAVACELCPRGCILTSGKTGKCRGRRNSGGAMVTLGYGYVCAAHTDPVEKKPLYHFLPGALAYSIAIAGCNLRCKNCQNYSISQVSPLETDVPYVSPQGIVDAAKAIGAPVIAYTYSEPTVWFEYMYDTAKLARKAGLKNVMVTSGYINAEPLSELAPYLDAAHIDLKGFDENVYRELNDGKLQPVLDTIVLAKQKGIWVEIVNLVVPQWTDDAAAIRRMCGWIRDHAGVDTPLHFSRFFPLYKLAQLYPTPEGILQQARAIAHEEKLRYVYVGNVPDIDSNTYCPQCKALCVERNGYLVRSVGMQGSKCGKCGAAIPGVWQG
jgi:pyruvate formate lyase activating enzyme